jgi:hypothetical protein
VDFDFASQPETITVIEDGKEVRKRTGKYIFENEWQSFRTISDRSLELTFLFQLDQPQLLDTSEAWDPESHRDLLGNQDSAPLLHLDLKNTSGVISEDVNDFYGY